jgi:hypothetical protein
VQSLPIVILPDELFDVRARGGLYSCGFPDDHTYETRASKISEDGKRMFRIEKKRRW